MFAFFFILTRPNTTALRQSMRAPRMCGAWQGTPEHLWVGGVRMGMVSWGCSGRCVGGRGGVAAVRHVGIEFVTSDRTRAQELARS